MFTLGAVFCPFFGGDEEKLPGELVGLITRFGKCSASNAVFFVEFPFRKWKENDVCIGEKFLIISSLARSAALSLFPSS